MRQKRSSKLQKKLKITDTLSLITSEFLHQFTSDFYCKQVTCMRIYSIKMTWQSKVEVSRKSRNSLFPKLIVLLPIKYEGSILSDKLPIYYGSDNSNTCSSLAFCISFLTMGLPFLQPTQYQSSQLFYNLKCYPHPRTKIGTRIVTRNVTRTAGV